MQISAGNLKKKKKKNKKILLLEGAWTGGSDALGKLCACATMVPDLRIVDVLVLSEKKSRDMWKRHFAEEKVVRAANINLEERRKAETHQRQPIKYVGASGTRMK